MSYARPTMSSFNKENHISSGSAKPNTGRAQFVGGARGALQSKNVATANVLGASDVNVHRHHRWPRGNEATVLRVDSLDFPPHCRQQSPQKPKAASGTLSLPRTSVSPSPMPTPYKIVTCCSARKHNNDFHSVDHERIDTPTSDREDNVTCQTSTQQGTRNHHAVVVAVGTPHQSQPVIANHRVCDTFRPTEGGGLFARALNDSLHLPSIPSAPSSVAPSHLAHSEPSISVTRCFSREVTVPAPSSGSAHGSSTPKASSTLKTLARAPTAAPSGKQEKIMDQQQAQRAGLRCDGNQSKLRTTNLKTEQAQSNGMRLAVDARIFEPEATPTNDVRLRLCCPVCGEPQGPALQGEDSKERQLINRVAATSAVEELVRHTTRCLNNRCELEKFLSRCINVPPAAQMPHTGTTAYMMIEPSDDGEPSAGASSCQFAPFTPSRGTKWWIQHRPPIQQTTGGLNSLLNYHGDAAATACTAAIRRLQRELQRMAASPSTADVTAEPGHLPGENMCQQAHPDANCVEEPSEFERNLLSRLDGIRARLLGKGDGTTTRNRSGSSSVASSCTPHPITANESAHHHLPTTSMLTLDAVRDYNRTVCETLVPFLRVVCPGGSSHSSHHIPWGEHDDAPVGTVGGAFHNHCAACWVLTVDIVLTSVSAHQYPKPSLSAVAATSQRALVRVAARLSDVHRWCCWQSAAKRLSRFALLLGGGGDAPETMRKSPDQGHISVAELTLQHLLWFCFSHISKKTSHRDHPFNCDVVSLATSVAASLSTTGGNGSSNISNPKPSVGRHSITVVPGWYTCRQQQHDGEAKLLDLDWVGEEDSSLLLLCSPDLPTVSTHLLEAGCTSYTVYV